NMRLRAGGEVTPENARHMGLFVVSRLADRHSLRVRLRGSATEDVDSGTTAEVYLPPTVLAAAGEDDAAPPAAARGSGRSAAAEAAAHKGSEDGDGALAES